MQFPKNIPCQAIMESLADGVFTVDTDWTVTFFNRAAGEIIGIAPEEAVGRKCWDVFHSSICDGACALRESMATGQPLPNSSIFIVRPDGEKIPVSISAAPLRDAKGRIVGGVETFRDISEIQRMRNELKGIATLDDIVTKSHLMSRILSMLPKIAASGSTVLILGESGTGKELFARAIHDNSPRAGRPFVVVDCASLTETLVESTLFGHRKGAFTGADCDRDGLVKLSDGGTLCLDEVGELPVSVQKSFLRVLQERRFRPVGAAHEVESDFRLIAATNRDLEEEVRRGAFREDLYYRLNVVMLTVPPLRERGDDITLLVRHFAALFAQKNRRRLEGITSECIDLLRHYPWPGNVRELENAIERGIILMRGEQLTEKSLPLTIQKMAEGQDAVANARPLSLSEVEKEMIFQTLDETGGNKSEAARRLGITRKTLLNKLHKYDEEG